MVMNEKEPERRCTQDPGYQKRRLPAMALAQDPALRGVKRTSPINRTCNELHGEKKDSYLPRHGNGPHKQVKKSDGLVQDPPKTTY